MTSAPSAAKYHSWPDSQETAAVFHAPPKGATNPVVRGAFLAAGAPLVARFNFVAEFLYKNAGFSRLRQMDELTDVKHRFDPTVVPLAGEGDPSKPFDPTDPAATSGSLFDAGKGWAPRSIRAYHEAYKVGTLTPTAVAEALIPLVSRDAPQRSPHSTAFLTTRADLVRAAAAASTARWAAGKPLGLLDGVPLAIKDEVELAGYPQSYGSARTVRQSTETSWCVAKWEEAGAVIVGKTNMHEIGMDTTNNNYVHGTPKSPYNETYYTGGSSGGSGYAVGAGLVPVALGCDGGGSIRIPSAYCGAYGLKTSHSRVSAAPAPDISGTTGVAGPIASDMESLAVAYRVMATGDPAHAASSAFPASRPLNRTRGKVLGIYRPWFDLADPPVRESCQRTVDWLVKERGYTVADIELPHLLAGQTAHSLTIMLEALNGLPQGSTSWLQPANRVLMGVAARCPTTDYLSAQKVRQVLMRHVAALFDKHGHDLIIVTPTTPNAGWHIDGGKKDLAKGITDGDKTVRSMTYVWLANFTGCPALSAPVGFVEPAKGAAAGRVPAALMGMGVWGGEEALIEWGFELEKYVHEGLDGGRLQAPAWVDVFELAKPKPVEEPAVEQKKEGEKEEAAPAEAKAVNGEAAPAVVMPAADAKAADDEAGKATAAAAVAAPELEGKKDESAAAEAKKVEPVVEPKTDEAVAEKDAAAKEGEATAVPETGAGSEAVAAAAK